MHCDGVHCDKSVHSYSKRVRSVYLRRDKIPRPELDSTASVHAAKRIHCFLYFATCDANNGLIAVLVH